MDEGEQERYTVSLIEDIVEEDEMGLMLSGIGKRTATQILLDNEVDISEVN